MRIVVIGAAPTGLGVAYRLHELQNNNNKAAQDVELIVLEQELSPGGLSRTVVDDKGFLWDMGGHITFNHNFPYYEKAMQWAVSEWNTLTRNCQVDVSYMFNERGLHLVPYPAQYSIPLFPANIKENCLRELRDLCTKTNKTNPPRNFDEWIMVHFGPTLKNYFFKLYTQKVWTVEPDQMNPTWVGTRVAKLPQEKLEELCTMDQSSLKVTDVDAKAKVITYENERNGAKQNNELTYDTLINTGPIDQLIKCTKLCHELDLKYNKVFIVGVGLKKPINARFERFTWLYFPEKTVPFYRVTFLSRYGEMTPDNSKYWSVMCECARTIDDKEVTEGEITKETIESLIQKSIITREQIVDQFSIVLPYGYPIPSINRDGELARAHHVLEKQNIFSRGRFGGWKYEASNQDHCFIQGKEIVDRLLLSIPETVYKNGLPTSQG